jgi:hypothetical protein
LGQEGVRQPPRGDSEPPDAIFDPFAIAVPLDGLAKNRI